ncbi:MAG TPA: hypothetical protein VHP32_00420 [Ignavibacteria bacterium]|nr:hypothetical protein [Ignavibacteria bacterium]
MEYINFQPLENVDVEIIYNNKIYDLHNTAEFLTFIYDEDKMKLTLIWIYPSEYFIKYMAPKLSEKFFVRNDINPNLEQKYISLEFKFVTNFENIEGDNELPIEESYTVSQFLPINETNNDLVIEFQNDSKMIIDAEEVYFNNDFKFSQELGE